MTTQTATSPFERPVCLICGAKTGGFYICEKCQARTDNYERDEEINDPEDGD